MSETRHDDITARYVLSHLLISQVENALLDDRRVRILDHLGGKSVRRADNDANRLVLGQQLFYHQPPCLPSGSNHQNGHRNDYQRLSRLAVPAPYYALFFKDIEGIKYEIVCCGEAARDSGAAR